MATLYLKEQGARLRKEQERLIVTRGEEQLIDVPVIKVDRVMVMGKGIQVSTAALLFLAQRGIPVIFTNQSGTIYKATVSAGLSNNGALRLAQARLIDDPARSLPLVQTIVAGKLVNQRTLLQMHPRTWGAAGARAIATIDRAQQDVWKSVNSDQARGYEGAGAAAYWNAWSGALQQSWGFTGREFYPPRDPINAVLSFGYTLLLNDVLAAVHAVGLDPFLGFFHTVEFGRPSLALDMEEEFRPVVVDALVLALLEARKISRTNFMEPTGRPGAIYLNDQGRLRFLEAYEERLQQRVRYPFTNTSETTRRCILLQVQQFARTIQGEQQRYQPLPWPAPTA
jgi:CRISPR-associated protein Cas1